MAQLPAAFSTYTRSLMGDTLYRQFLNGMEEEAPVSIRLNPFKCKLDDISTTFPSTPVPWCPTSGRYLEGRPAFTFDPLLHAGMYYVQEASSMFVDLVVRKLVNQPVTALDLCAAPGGKSTALRSALPEGSLLFSNEPMRTRAQILSENIQKFGHPDVVVTNNYPKDYKKSKLLFDVILCDVPCSGEGMFRKDEGAVKEWSPQNVDNCWQLQREIVSEVWSCLKPGGILIYSTCTFNAHEDEENVAWIAEELGADFINLPVETSWNITRSLIDNNPVYRFIPGKSRGEGLFLAVLRKQGTYEEPKNTRPIRSNNKPDKYGNLAETWLKSQGKGFVTITQGDCIYAIPAQWQQVFLTASKALKLLHAGVKLGTIKGKDIIPDQSLALSTLLYKEAFSTVDLNYEDAIRFLRKEAITLPADTPKGYTLITYRNIPIGWEKNIGNRANNLYPAEWKIKSSHIPEGTNDLLVW